MALTAAQRRLRSQIAANTRWANEDPTPTATCGQAGLLARFERQVDPRNELHPVERYRRAQAARKAHMQRLALASSKARAVRKAAVRRTGEPAA
jgi:hypothetical protein